MAGSLFRDANPDGTVGSDTIIQTLHLIRRTVTDDTVVRSIVGVLLIAFAQIFTATQFVLEEYILEKYAMEPLKVVGYEGLFGFSVTLIGMVILHFIIGRTDAGRYGYFDAEEGLKEMRNKNVLISSLLIMVSIGFVSLFSLFLHSLTTCVYHNLLLCFHRLRSKTQTTNCYSNLVHSTSSAFPSPVQFPPLLVQPSIHAVHSLSGLYPWHSAGKPSNGCKSLDSAYWSMAPSCSTKLFDHR